MFPSLRFRKGHAPLRARPTPIARRFRPVVEALEERRLLSKMPIVVNTTGDSPFVLGNQTSLRAAILAVDGDMNDSAADPDIIHFDIPQNDPGGGYDPKTGVWTISPNSPGLPTIKRPVIIDGYSQSGASPNTATLTDNAVLKIQLNGANAGNASGLDISAGNSQVDGLIINGWGSISATSPNGGGIRLDTNGGDTIIGNFIGTNYLGASGGTNGLGLPVDANIGAGVSIEGCGNNKIGDGTSAGRNILSNNNGTGVAIDSGATGNRVTNNFIGVDFSGATALGNTFQGIVLYNAPGNRIESNTISGNDGWGIVIRESGSTDNLVRGNYIGSDDTGLHPVPNSVDGIVLFNGANSNHIGDGVIANLISGNGGAGVKIAGTGTNSNLVQGNYIGTSVDGTTRLGSSGGAGVLIDSGAQFNIIGTNGDGVNDPAERNLISGNGGGPIPSRTDALYDNVDILHSDYNVVAGNLIGTNCNQTAAIGSVGGADGVWIDGGQYNRIGTNADGVSDSLERNVIAGNPGHGIELTGAGHNVIAGNLIGRTDVTAAASLANALNGVFIHLGSAFNTVGGASSVSRNVISGNGASGVAIQDPTTANNVVESNFIGTDYTGTQRLGNLSNGVDVQGAMGNRIGMVGAGNVISDNRDVGVFISGTGANSVQANFVGTDASGEHSLGNTDSGVWVDYSSGPTLIGTDGDGVNDPAERNVISGNGYDGIAIYFSSGVVVAGNYVGTDATAEIKLPNAASGVEVLRSQGNRVGNDGVGNDGAGERNVISGNALAGVTLDGLDTRGNQVAGNFIGTDAGGQAPLPNGRGVRLINGANGNTIGGSNPGDGNVISGNTDDGLDIRGNGLPAGAVADYPAEGNATDALGFNKGTIQGNVTFEPGRFGQAFQFDGASGEGVNIPASPSLDVGAGAGSGLTLAAWINPNPDDVSTQQPIIEWTNGVHLWFSVSSGGAPGSGDLYANLRSGPTDHIIFSPPGIIQADHWQFVALTYDQGSGVATLFVNGAQVAQQYLGSFTPSTTGDVNLGHRVSGSFSGSGQFSGGMDEVSIYNRALSFVEVSDTLATVNGAGENSVLGNHIGTALDPRIKLANGGDGVVLDNTSFNEVGISNGAANPNVIAGNLGRGVFINGSGSLSNFVSGNSIGTDLTGTVHRGNGSDGVLISEGADFNFIDRGNLIAYNSGNGVVVGDGLNDPSYGNEIQGNRGIFDNAGLGIDLGDDGVTPNTGLVTGDANALANFPVITSAQSAGGVTVVTATVHGLPNTTRLFINFYADPSPDPTGYGQGQALVRTLSNVPTDPNGDATVTDYIPLNLVGQVVTATATDFQLGTSEFAQDVAVTPLVPTLTGLGQLSTTEGAQVLTVNGTNFVTGAVVCVNGMPLATTFVNGSQLRAAVPAGLLEEGTASVTVANPAPGGGTSNALSLAITDAPLGVTGSAISATGSTPFTGVVGTFSDTGGSEPAGSYTAVIAWGDGSTSPGTVVPNGSGFNVVGSHTYQSASVSAGVNSPYTTTVTASDEGGNSASGTGSATVAHAPLVAWGQNVSLTEGTSGPLVVALVSDLDPRDAGSDFAATITWENGKTSSGTVTPAGGGLFQVTGNHAYAEEGNYPVAVSIQDDRGAAVMTTSTAVVTDAPLTAIPVTLTVTGSTNFSGIVGLFTDADPAGTAKDYTATITWDDGSTSAGVVSGFGPFVVTAAHQFGTFKGPHAIVVSVTDAGGAATTLTDTVIDPPQRHATPPHVSMILKATGTPSITVASSSLTAGGRFTLTVTVEDAFGNVVRGFVGTLHFTSTDDTARLPKDYTLRSANRGVHTFTGLVLHKKGIQTITISNPLDSSITASVIVDVQ
jgi:titin